VEKKTLGLSHQRSCQEAQKTHPERTHASEASSLFWFWVKEFSSHIENLRSSEKKPPSIKEGSSIQRNSFEWFPPYDY
jgi:hypothetical protein